jgi:cytochrome c-type biogenesis protein CcmH/NrfG
MKKRKGSVYVRFGGPAVLACVLMGAVAPLAAAENIYKAEELYKHTDFAGSIALLSPNSQNPAALFLLGRDYFMLGDFKRSADYLQKATAAEPNNSEYVDWLGRAYGRRAETANFLTAPGYATKARQAFERAVALDTTNRDALSDLFDYYLEAPGFMGGGYEKALAVAQKMAVVDPPQGYFAEAQLAQKRKEFPAAEQQLRQAIAAAPYEVGHIIALAKFLANQGRTRESDDMFATAEQVNPNAPQVWFAHADVLIKQKRDLQEARNLLQKYVRAPITVDDPPKQSALQLLKQAGGE